MPFFSRMAVVSWSRSVLPSCSFTSVAMFVHPANEEDNTLSTWEFVSRLPNWRRFCVGPRDSSCAATSFTADSGAAPCDDDDATRDFSTFLFGSGFGFGFGAIAPDNGRE